LRDVLSSSIDGSIAGSLFPAANEGEFAFAIDCHRALRIEPWHYPHRRYAVLALYHGMTRLSLRAWFHFALRDRRLHLDHDLADDAALGERAHRVERAG